MNSMDGISEEENSFDYAAEGDNYGVRIPDV